MKDRFSKQASTYAAFRPTYPMALYDFILPLVEDKGIAWDCATGNGQVARDIAPHFRQVMATDSSQKQIENAVKLPNIQYSVSKAEKTSFPDSTFDLITVGQAIHWFDFDAFYKEVERVAKPNALLAIWGYGLLKINPSVDDLINDFYTKTIGPYWDAERRHVDHHYRTIPFPFDEIPSPEFSFSFFWTIDELAGYLNTWSSVQKYKTAHSTNPVDELISRIKPLWLVEKNKVNFPLFMKCGRIKA